MNGEFFAIGINHLSAPIHFRERLVRAEPALEDSLGRLKSDVGLDQIVLLSTCSRFEIYGYSEQSEQSRERVVAWFERKGGVEVRRYLNMHAGTEAVAHLFRVSAGLESWIIGESEILSQVKKAYQKAFAQGCTGAELNRLFQSALAAGKSARAQSGIQNGIHSVGGASALLARRIFGEERQGRVVVFGAGEAAEAVCRHLAAKNFGRITVANRTLERAEELARQIGGTAVSFEDGLSTLAEVEVAVFSTSCSKPIVEESWLSAKLAGRGRSLFMIDLGLPRNVSPECASLPGVYVYDLSHLKDLVEQSMSHKAGAKHEAEAIVNGAVGECLTQLEKARSRRASELFAARVG